MFRHQLLCRLLVCFLQEALLRYLTTELKYEGYIQREQEQIEQAQKQENIILPENIDYTKIHGLRLEAQQKLSEIKPQNIGQASRISGVSPADIAVLICVLKQNKNL